MRLFLAILSALVLFAAGFFRLTEILLEWVFIGYFMFHPGVAIPGHSKRSITVGNPKLQKAIDFLYRKRDSIADLLHGGQPTKAVLFVVLGGVLFGWVAALAWFAIRDYRFVAARELIETAFDIVLFGAVLYFLRGYFRDYLEDLAEAKRKDNAATAATRAVEDEMLNVEEPDDDYGQPVGSFGAFSIGGSQKNRAHMDYFIRRGLRGQSIFATVDDVRDEEDYDAQESWEKKVSRGFVISGYAIVLLGVVIFFLGSFFSLFHFVPITDLLSGFLFSDTNE